MCVEHINTHILFDVDLFPICSQQQIPNNVISDVCVYHWLWKTGLFKIKLLLFSSRSHEYQHIQSINTAAEMDPSVLWCLGPDFDRQTVLSLLGDSNYVDSNSMQPTTPTWCTSLSQWNMMGLHEAPIYTPRSVMSELGPQSPTSGATKRPFSDVSNRTTGQLISMFVRSIVLFKF